MPLPCPTTTTAAKVTFCFAHLKEEVGQERDFVVVQKALSLGCSYDALLCVCVSTHQLSIV